MWASVHGRQANANTIPGDAGRRVCEDSLYCLIFLQIHNCWKIQSLHKGGQEGGLG